MNIRPTTKRRVAILIIVFVLAIGAAVGAYMFRQHQLHEAYMADRAAGLAAYNSGDYKTALKDLSRYNQWQQRDPQTLFAFARARSRIELPNYAHLAEAIAYYRRGLELDPKNTQAKHELLAIYIKPYVGYNAEAISLADELLKTNPKDIAALKSKATALYRLRRLDQAMATAETLNKVAPLDMEGQQLSYELMYQLNRPADQIMGRAEKAYKAHPNDPRFEMLLGYAYMLTGQFDQAKTHLVSAARAKQTDPVVVRELCGMLDSMRLYDESNALLDRSATKDADPEMERMLIRRLWQTGSFDQVASRLKNLSTEAGDTQLLAYKALSLYQLNQTGAAEEITAALKSRKTDDIALAWAKAISVCFARPPLSESQQIAGYESALSRDPSNAVIRDMLGQSYAQMGESEPALQQWNMVAEAVPSWATPRTQIARLLAATGRAQMAIDEATKAYDRAQNIGSAIGLAVAWATEADQNDDPAVVGRVLQLTSDIQAKFPEEPQTLPIYASMLARSGQTNKARQVIQSAIKSTHLIDEDALIRLAQVSRANNFGYEKSLFAKSQKLHGLTPELALAIASTNPNTRLAAATLRKEADTATSQQVRWKLGLAKYLQSINDPTAKQTWIELGNAEPDNLAIQAAIADLPEDSQVWQDRDFIQTTINRLHQITGDQGQRWQLAKARWLLGSPDKSRDSAQAVVLLTQLVRTSPNMLVPRMYLARALENLNETNQAIDQLKSATEIDPGSANISLQLVQLLQGAGRFDEAAPYLDSLKSNQTLTSKQRLQVAALLARSGENDQAMALLGHVGPSSTTDLLRAALLRRKGNISGAAQIYRGILAQAHPDAHAVLESAEFFAMHGQSAAAQEAIKSLSRTSATDQERQLLLAQFDEDCGSSDDALKTLKQTSEKAPSEQAFVALAGFQLRHRDYPATIAAANQGLKIIPNSAALNALKSDAAELQSATFSLDASALIDSLSRNPLDRAGQDTLSALLQQQGGPELMATRLEVCAEKYPRFMPAQKLSFDAAMKLKHLDNAAKIANRCMDAFPNDPQAAEMNAIVCTANGQWSDMLAAARQWRQRTMDNPLLPDLAIAEAQMQMAEAGDAVKQLQPYVADALENPDQHRNVIVDYCRALVLSGRQKDAAKILSPLLGQNENWRALWLKLASEVNGADSAAAWIQQVSAAIPAKDYSQQQSLAATWYQLGVRYGYRQGFVEARQIARKIVSESQPDASVYLILAASSEKLSDSAAAVAAYRQALALEPNLPVAENNLAYRLLQEGKDLSEARELAEKAVAARSNDVAYRDTLAQIFARLGDHRDAIDAYKALVRLQPNDVPAHIAYARTLLAAGERDHASEVLSQIDSLVRSDPTGGTAYQQDLQSLRESLSK